MLKRPINKLLPNRSAVAYNVSMVFRKPDTDPTDPDEEEDPDPVIEEDPIIEPPSLS